jgi:cobalt-zinc-cadmium efflux system protein
MSGPHDHAHGHKHGHEHDPKSGHDAHAGHDHAGHGHDDHAGHDHDAHDHSGHDHGSHAGHAGHDHAAPKRGGHTHADHNHDHGHGGHHHHHGDPATQGRAFAIAIALNSLFVVIEFVYGFLANSTALMADAGHNLSDVLGLMLAWGAAILAKRVPSARFTYGLRSTSMLAALFNAMMLMLTCGAIVWEAARQLFHPDPVAGMTVSVVAAIGIAVNGFSAWLFVAGSKGDINIRGAYLHMAADAAISLAVLVSGLVVMATGWYWLDPAVSIAIVLMIMVSTWSLLSESLRMMLAAVPDNVDAARVEAFLRASSGVGDVHDLHIWAMSTTETALTAHLVMPAGYPGDSALDAIGAQLKEKFAIHHSTLQVEMGTTSHECCLHGESV